MTCSLNTYGKISNLENIIQFLSNKDETSFNQISSVRKKDEWSNDWDWDDESERKNQDNENRKQDDNKATHENWFDKFHLSFSPCGNLAVFASKHNIIICQGKWDMNNQIKFSICSRIDINEADNEYVTAVICIPIASQRISGEGLLEWTCILVGFSNGNIKMFTENGTLLINQMFHDTKVLKLKCRTFEIPKYIGWITQPEEIEILYENNVLVCIDGSNLYHYLRAARKYAANMSTDQNDIMESISSLNLDYKKWKFDSQESLTDFVSAGLTGENRFDQLFAACMIGGPNEKFESIPPMSNRYLACGQSPFISFYYAFEGTSQPVLTEVKAVAGKITSSLMNAAKGWMGFNKAATSVVKPKPKIEPPTPLSQRFGLQDYRRNGSSIIISPANNLAATTDSFARVILIDVLKGIAVRIFKGYRDAQIGWICIDDESDEKLNKRYALYLVIYAPRRGLLEIWGCQQGIRVAAFNVGKNCRLIFPGYFMLSLNGSLLNNQFKSNQQIQCFLVTADGLIKTLHIPFHLILSDKNNQRVRDTILLKKLKSILKEHKTENDNLWNNIKILIYDFKTPSIKQQALEKILYTNYLSPNLINEIFCKELEQIEKQGDNLSSESHKLGQFCRFNCKLIKSFIFVNELVQNSEKDDVCDTENLKDLTQIDENDFRNYIEMKKLLEKKNKNKKKVKFSGTDLTKEFDLPKFLSCFEFISNSNLDSSNLAFKDYSRKRYFELNKNISAIDKEHIGAFLFSKYLNISTKYDVQLFKSFLDLIPLKKIKLFDLLVHAWLGNDFMNMINLYNIMLALSGCSNVTSNIEYEPLDESKKDLNKDPDDLEDDDFENTFISGYFPKFKTTIESSTSLIQSLLLVWITRSIVAQSNVETIQIETLSILSDRLFSIIKLNILFLCGEKSILNNLDFEFNIKNILIKGKGVLSELTSKHCVLNEIPANLLDIIEADETNEETKNNKESEENKDESDDSLKLLKNEFFKEFYDTLQETRKYLPKSLEPDTLLLNCAWESILFYNKDNEKNVKYLDSSLRYCGEIGNAILKQGVLSMIWHNNLSKKVVLLTDFIDKVGKFPREKQVRKEIGINEETVEKFLQCVMNLLDLIMDANCSINEVPIFNYDQFWKENSDYNDLGLTTNMILSFSNSSIGLSKANSTSSKQLVELAAEQKHVNYHLCLFQYQLIRILFLIVKYNMKSVKPYSFFDTKGKQALFSELHTHPLISNDVDIKILNSRKLFFTKALNAIMEGVKNPSNIKAKLPDDINENLSIVFNLSKDMGVELEYVKRYYCCLLYALDYHSEAEKVLHGIKETELLASQLLVVVGYKVNEILEANFDPNLVAILSTNLNSWLKSIGNSDFRIYTVSSKQALLELIGIVLNRLPDTFSEYKIAVELFDFIENPLFKI